MKTKKLFLMVAMLLMSVGAFAQNGNSLKGDVNGDGKVDVADIVAIIDIMKNGGGSESDGKMYFYVGTTQPTAENYKTIGTQVTSYQSDNEYTSSERAYVYVMVADDKDVTFIEPTLNAPIDASILTDVNIPGHKVYKSDIKLMGKVYIKIKSAQYSYVGTTQPTTENYKNIATVVAEYPSDYSYTIQSEIGRAYLYGIVASNKIMQFIEPNFNVAIDTIELTDVSIPGHKVIRSATKCSGTLPVKITDM